MIHNSRLVYRTDNKNLCDQCGKRLHKCRCKNLRPDTKKDNTLEIHFETKGRKGSGVTIISGLDLSEQSLKVMTSNLKKYCGVGGTTKAHAQIELQGDQRAQLERFFKKSKQSGSV